MDHNYKKFTNILFDLIALIICSFAIFYSVFYLVYYINPNFDHKIALSDILSYSFTLFIALYVPFSVWKKIEQSRNAKGILINKCTELQLEAKNIIELIELLINKNYPKSNKKYKHTMNLILFYFKRIWTKTILLKETSDDKLKKTDWKKIFQKFLNFRNITTKDIKNKNFKISEKYFLDSFNSYLDFENEIEVMKFTINDL